MEKIKEKNILIVGATGSIGAATAKLLATTGANVFLTGRNESRLREVANDCKVDVSRMFVMDIADPFQVQYTADAIHQEIGAVDAIINTAGIGIIKPFEQLTEDDFRKTLEVNLMGTVYLMKSFLPPMKEKKEGLIIHLPGVLGKTPMSGASAYAASKYGLNGFMKSLREELKRTNIRITQIFLGGVDSHFWDNIDLRVQRDKMIIAEEAAKAIWFLCQQPTSGVVSEMVLQPFNHQAI
jgi:short-subunit dehydrogenase